MTKQQYANRHCESFRSRWRVLFLAFFAISGCAAAQSYTITTSFNEADFLPYTGKGPATLNGQAFMKTVGGDVKTCAGNKVYLMPGTPYNDEIIAHSHGNVSMANRDERASKYLRTGICDVSGKFTFEQLPAKKWYVLVDVTWGVVRTDLYFGGIDKQGGLVIQTADLKPGTNQVILTDADYVR